MFCISQLYYSPDLEQSIASQASHDNNIAIWLWLSSHFCEC